MASRVNSPNFAESVLRAYLLGMAVFLDGSHLCILDYATDFQWNNIEHETPCDMYRLAKLIVLTD